METKNIDQFDSLLRSKNFDQLTDAEQQWVLEMVDNEDSYNHLRSLVTRLQDEFTRDVKTDVQRNLIREFKSSNQSVLSNLLSYRVPAYVPLLLLGLFVAGVWQIRPVEIQEVEKQVVVPVTHTDTLFVQKTDTVFVERVVRVNVPILEKPTTDMIKPAVVVKGNSMSNQKELKSLLVSGE